MILKLIASALVITVIGGVLIIGIASLMVIIAAIVVTVEHFRMNKSKSPRPPRAWRKRSIEERENG